MNTHTHNTHTDSQTSSSQSYIPVFGSLTSGLKFQGQTAEKGRISLGEKFLLLFLLPAGTGASNRPWLFWWPEVRTDKASFLGHFQLHLSHTDLRTHLFPNPSTMCIGGVISSLPASNNQPKVAKRGRSRS